MFIFDLHVNLIRFLSFFSVYTQSGIDDGIIVIRWNPPPELKLKKKKAELFFIIKSYLLF